MEYRGVFERSEAELSECHVDHLWLKPRQNDEMQLEDVSIAMEEQGMRQKQKVIPAYQRTEGAVRQSKGV